jgi:glycosyltransferase involved in cell wall biosynthesis
MHCGTSFARKVDFRAEIARTIAEAGRPGARVVPSAPVGLEELVSLMHRCHAFVLPTKGEGWGLPILEAMACELPCIVTDYSGLTEYANDDNCYLIRVHEMKKVEDPEFFHPAFDWGQWAQPDTEHLRHLMRFVYEHPDYARQKARRGREEAERYWTWDMAAEKAMAHIRELRGLESPAGCGLI